MQFQSIQCLRALAACFVLLFHLDGRRFPLAGAGVLLFFVISGVIMGRIGARESPLPFIWKRIARVVPLYWIVTFLMCAMASLGLMNAFTWDMPRLLASLLFLPHLDPNGRLFPLVVPGWTLNYEMLFYAIFALSLLRRHAIALCISCLLALMAAGWVLKPAEPTLAFWTAPILSAFVIGLVQSRIALVASRAVASGLIMAGFLGLMAFIMLPPADPFLNILAMSGIAVLLIHGSMSLESAGGWPRWTWPLARLGDASYSLYLWHALVISFGHRVLGASPSVQMLIVIVSLAIAHLSYRMIERPITRWLAGGRGQAARRRGSIGAGPSSPAISG